MQRILYIFILSLLFTSGIDVQGKSYYNTVDNNFGGLFPHPGMRMQGRYKGINGDRLIEENATIANASTIDTMLINSTTYRYQLRFANLNNKQGMTKSIKNPMTGDKTTITSPEWGLIFNRDDDGGLVLRNIDSTQYETLTKQQRNQFGKTTTTTYKSMTW